MKTSLLAAAIAVAAAFLATPGSIAEEMMAPEKSPPAAKAAPGPAKPVSRSEEILQRFDKNHDGRLDDDEKADAHEVMLQEQMGKEEQQASAQALKEWEALASDLFDRNFDGRIDPVERLEALAFVERDDPAAVRETLLLRFDRNRDGKLDEAEQREANAYATEHRGELMREVLFKRYDVNANGHFEPEEKMAIRAAFRGYADNSRLFTPAETSKEKSTPAPAGDKP
jgi:Ca2+-binding EF-hand superfamily protein